MILVLLVVARPANELLILLAEKLERLFVVDWALQRRGLQIEFGLHLTGEGGFLFYFLYFFLFKLQESIYVPVNITKK